jgi:hypothetical protein
VITGVFNKQRLRKVLLVLVQIGFILDLNLHIGHFHSSAADLQLSHLSFDLLGKLSILLQPLNGVLAPLANVIAFVAILGPL